MCNRRRNAVGEFHRGGRNRTPMVQLAERQRHLLRARGSEAGKLQGELSRSHRYINCRSRVRQLIVGVRADCPAYRPNGLPSTPASRTCIRQLRCDVGSGHHPGCRSCPAHPRLKGNLPVVRRYRGAVGDRRALLPLQGCQSRGARVRSTSKRFSSTSLPARTRRWVCG